MSVNKYLSSLPSLEGKTIVVTGANSGLGFATVQNLLAKNASVIMLNRSETRTLEAILKLKKEFPSAVISYYLYDQSDKVSIDNVVKRLKENKEIIDGYVLNAGLYMPSKKAKTKDNIALTFGVNFCGNYFLVKALASENMLTENVRIVFTSSLASYHRFSAVLLEKLISGNVSRHRQYEGSKVAINIFALGLINRGERVPFKVGSGIYLFHPGISNSNIARFKFPPLRAFAHLFMKVVFHSPRKAVLGALVALTSKENLNNMMIAPRGLFEMSGFPKIKKLDKSLTEHVGYLIERIEKI